MSADSADLFRLMLDHLPDAVLVHQKGKILFANPAALQIFRASRLETLVGKDILALLHSQEQINVLTRLQRALRGKPTPPSEERLVRFDGSEFPAEITTQSITYQSAPAELVLLRDISAEKQDQIAVFNRERILQAAALISAFFLRQPDWESALRRSLETLAVQAGVSRVYLYENQPAVKSEWLVRLHSEWAAAGLTPLRDATLHIQWSFREVGLRRWEQQLRADKPVAGTLDDFPKGEKPFLARKQTQSTAILPIYTLGSTWGFLGLDDCSQPRVWSSGELEALRQTADVLGAALEHRQMTEELSEIQNRFHDLFEFTPLAITEQDFSRARQVLLDLRRAGVQDLHQHLQTHPDIKAAYFRSIRLVDANRAALQLYAARSKGELIARFTQIAPAENQLITPQELEAVLSGQMNFQKEVVNQTINHAAMHVDLRFVVLPGYEKDLSRVIVTAVDITQRVQAEASAQERQIRIQTLLQAIPDLMFVYSNQGVFLEAYTQNPEDLFTPIDQVIGKTLDQVLPPDQAAKSLDWIKKTLAKNQMQIWEYPLEIQGQTKHFESRVIPFGEHRVLAIIRNITERKASEMALKDAQTQLAQRVTELENRNRETAAMAEMINLLQISTGFDEALGIIEQFCMRLFPEMAGAFLDLDEAHTQLRLRRAWNHPSLTGEIFQRNDCWAVRRGRSFVSTNPETGPVCQHVGTPLPSSYLCVPILAQGQIVGLLHLQTPAEQAVLTPAQQQLAVHASEQIGLALSNLILREKLQRQAVHDDLTGLFNYSYMEGSLERELYLASTTGAPVSIIMLDLDHFKDLNTQFGHPRVNQFLRQFGRRLRQVVRAEDVPCRYGGDEFRIVLPHTGFNQASELAETLRVQIRSLPIQSESVTTHFISASIGVACSQEHGLTIEELLEAVDQAVYRAKTQNDCVIIALPRALNP